MEERCLREPGGRLLRSLIGEGYMRNCASFSLVVDEVRSLGALKGRWGYYSHEVGHGLKHTNLSCGEVRHCLGLFRREGKRAQERMCFIC